MLGLSLPFSSAVEEQCVKVSIRYRLAWNNGNRYKLLTEYLVIRVGTEASKIHGFRTVTKTRKVRRSDNSHTVSTFHTNKKICNYFRVLNFSKIFMITQQYCVRRFVSVNYNNSCTTVAIDSCL